MDDFSLVTFRSDRGQKIYDRLFEAGRRMFGTGGWAEDKMLVAMAWVIFSVLSEWEKGTITYTTVRHLETVVGIFESIEKETASVGTISVADVAP